MPHGVEVQVGQARVRREDVVVEIFFQSFECDSGGSQLVIESADRLQHKPDGSEDKQVNTRSDFPSRDVDGRWKHTDIRLL